MKQQVWKLLSVADFLKHFNQPNRIDSTAIATRNDVIWQKQTVQAFFDHYPWIVTQTQVSNHEPITLKLSVASYVQQFQWNAPIKNFTTASPHPSKSPEELLTPSSSLNLQNFSDLF